MAAAPFDADLLRAIVETASDGIFLTDQTFRVEWVNPQGRELLGRTLEELAGRSITDFFAPDHPLNAEPIRRDDLMAGRTTLTRRAFVRPDGSIRVLEVAATSLGPGRMLGIARDVTELIRQRERTSLSEASFRALIEASPDGIVVHRGGLVLYANRAMAELLGFATPTDLTGHAVIELVHPDDREQVQSRVRSLNAGEATVPFTEERLLRRDGAAVRCSIGGVRVVFEGEVSTLAVARDVTAQRRMQAQLALSDRMASLGELAAGVAHEINNPLAYVMLHLEGIEAIAARDGAPETLEHARTALEGAERVRRIVRDLRVFSRREEDETRRPVDVLQPLGLALATATHEIKHRARVVLELDPVPPVCAVEGRLVQVFLNLLLNAAHAIPDGDPERHAISVRTSTAARGSEVRISIEDTGEGIPADRIPRLFEPFFTTKGIGAGSGLGLAICHGIVGSLEGRIAVESVVGRGSTFSVFLPAAPSRAEPEAARAAAPDAAPPIDRRLRVLVVDDEPSILRALEVGLSAYEVVIASSGVAAQSLLERDARFDAVVCDVLMPGVGGAQLHAWAVEHRPELEPRMIFVSGGRIGAAAHQLAERVGERWLEKPFALARLEAMIESVAR